MDWYVLRSKQWKENSLCTILKSKEIEFYNPGILSKKANTLSLKTTPLFSGYIFVRFNLDKCGKNYFRWIPFSRNLINYGGLPAIVPDNIIHGIQQKINILNHKAITINSNYKSGDFVKIVDGPFQDYHALFDMHLSSKDRVRVLLQLIGDNKMPLVLNIEQLSMHNSP